MEPINKTIDEQTVSQWAEQFGPLIRGYIQSRVFHSQTAEDLTQDVFCRVWQAKEKYQDSGSPKSYLFCIADRLVIDWRRKKKRIY